jgi:plastocyanin
MKLLAALLAVGLLPASAPPARVQVVAREFSFSLSRPQVRAGRVVVELANFGEDAHDLRLRRRGGWRTYGIGVVTPDRQARLSARLLAGRYTLWCSVADHRARGMRATLIVRART